MLLEAASLCRRSLQNKPLNIRLFFSSEDWEKTYWEIQISRKSFQNIIDLAKKKRLNTQAIKHADWLRRVRNELSAHPLYVGDLFEHKEGNVFTTKKQDQQIWANKIMQRDLASLLKFIEPASKRKEFEETKVSLQRKDNKESNEKIVEALPFKDWLKKHTFDLSNFSLWYSLQPMFLGEIAFEAYKKMVSVLHTLTLDKLEL